MKVYGGTGITPLILKLGSIWRVNSHLHGPATFLLVKEPPVQTEKRRGWPLGQSGNFREQNLFPNSPALSLVTTLTELAWCHIREVCLGNWGRHWSWCEVNYMAVTLILLADNGGQVLPSSSRHWYYAWNYKMKHITQALTPVHTQCTCPTHYENNNIPWLMHSRWSRASWK